MTKDGSSRGRDRMASVHASALSDHTLVDEGTSPMTLVVRAVSWVALYLGAVLAPLVFAIGASHPDHGFWTDFSVALGFVGLAMMGLKFALVARFRPLIPIPTPYRFRRV